MGVNMGSVFKKDSRVKGKGDSEFAGKCGTIIDKVYRADINGKITVLPNKWRIRFDGSTKTYEVDKDKLIVLD
jgi:hypothetical protein